MQRYNPVEIEKKWQKVWEDNKTYQVDFADHSKPKYYGFSMLPGITGAGIHVGHGRTFQFSDIKVRAKRQQGYNAYHPIGWDSFGLPVENYAIKIGKTPRVAHDEARVIFKNQLKRLGYSYDWTKEISTADPKYYRWTQWIFNKLFEHGLAYQKQSPQWWCETCQTVLANEQAEGGKCWRCGNQVSKRNLKQWFFKITDYADEILEATDGLDWTEMVKVMQKNWIGRSEGAEVDFKIDGHNEKLTVFTTRPDTLFGATFVVLAPEHELVKSLTTDETRQSVEGYVAEAARKSEIERMNETREKTGVFTGSYAINPVNEVKVPIWVADYVLSGYGTGAIMAVPAHDERDFEFAKKFDIPVITVVKAPEGIDDNLYTGEGVMANSGKFDGMASSEAREEIVDWLEKDSKGKTKVTYKMRDWLISRQRYWGAPIPIIHCDDCGAVPVPDNQLPVILPDVDDFKPKDGNTSALAAVTDWVNVPCPKCGKMAKRETDTMDGYACSSWYFLRYLDPFNEDQAWSKEIENYWGPVDFYNGADHAIAHLLYARFWQRFFFKLGLVSHPEPFKRMMYNAYIVASDGTKMSKSRGNTVDPLEIMDSGYGADSLRVYEIFIAPYDLEAPWDTRGVPGTYRFLNRVWTLTQEYIDSDKIEISEKDSQQILVFANKTAKKVTEDIESEKFNTCISAMMEAVNNYYKFKVDFGIGKCAAWDYAIESLLQVLSPFAPHITEELWSQIGHKDTIHIDHWPQWDDKYLKTDMITVVIQVNSKVRAKIEASADISAEDVKKLAMGQENVVKFIDGKTPSKIIYIPGKLINIVVD
jgi:leucyl-tRNA synthetase